MDSPPGAAYGHGHGRPPVSSGEAEAPVKRDDLLATIPTDANGQREFGFGDLRKGLTAEQRAGFNSGPKNLGQLVSGKNKQNKSKAKDSGEGSESARPNSSGKIPPGQAKKLARSQSGAQ